MPELLSLLKTSVVDPDPHGSKTFAWIRIRNYTVVPDPDQAKYEKLINKKSYICELWTVCTVGLADTW